MVENFRRNMPGAATPLAPVLPAGVAVASFMPASA